MYHNSAIASQGASKVLDSAIVSLTKMAAIELASLSFMFIVATIMLANTLLP